MSFSSLAHAAAPRLACAASVCLLLLIFLSDAAAQPVEFTRGPPPAWVAPLEPARDLEPPENQITDGTYHVLLDFQTWLGPNTRTQFRHFAAQALSPTGVESLASIQVAFDPAFQTLTLHELAVIRDGRRLSQIDTADVQILRRETDLERSILDGTKTATILLSDVRVGDVVEHAYSIEGINPAFDGRHFGTFSLQWEQPVRELRLRLVHPDREDLAVRPVNIDVKPTSTVHGGMRDLRWRRDNLPPLGVENDGPSWHDPYPRIEWSSFGDWQEVARWADALYRDAEASSPQLRTEIEGIAAQHEGAEARLLAALRFVQREVRYTGIEIGAGSFRPRAPDLVFERRFGDCKDKTLLLAAILRSLGIDAQPALVDVDRIVESTVQLPHPGYFDHVIVRARIDGKDYWLDPTRPTQVAPLHLLFQPDFGLALVVDRATRALERMPAARRTKREITATFDSSAGIGKPAKLTVRTAAHGGGAESLRQDLASVSRDDLKKQYLRYYATYHDGIRSTAPLDIVDDVTRNVVTVTEHYEIPDLWPFSESDSRHVASLQMADMLDMLPRTSSAERTAPIALAHPQEVSLTTIIELPEDWPLEATKGVLKDPHFRFEHELGGSPTRQVFKQTYRTLADHVAPAAVGEFVENVNRARAEVGYEYYYNTAVPAETLTWPARINWTVVLVAVMLLGLFAGIARRAYRWDPPPRPVAAGDRLQGIGGWLLLPAIGVLVSPFVALWPLYEGVEAYMHPSWQALTHPGGASYHAAWAPLLLFELAVQLAMFALALLALVLFVRKRTSAPAAYTALLVSGLALSVVDLALIATLELPGTEVSAADRIELTREFFSGLIWGTYMLTSRRVGSTFVRRLTEAPAVAPTPTRDDSDPPDGTNAGVVQDSAQYGIPPQPA